MNIPVPLFGSPLYTYKVTLLVYSHHFHEVSYVLMSLLDIAMTLERLCICKGVYCLVCWNTCMCLHMDTHNSIHVLPHSPSSCILLWKWTPTHLWCAYLLLMHILIYVWMYPLSLLLQSACYLCVVPIITPPNSLYPCGEMKAYCHLYLYAYIDLPVLTHSAIWNDLLV